MLPITPDAQPPPEAPLLEMRGITKLFPGVRALDHVDFTLRRGEIHALLGENGAGKSTLIKILTGVYRRDGGTVRLAGRPITPRSPLHAQSLGISTVYQEVNLIPHLSVAENIFLGRQPMRFGRIDWRRLNVRAAETLGRLALRIDVREPLASLSIAIQQMVALARALDVRCQVLILDEPTSSLDAQEVEQLFAVVRRLRNEGLGIVFITHFLEQVYSIAGRLTVLRNGALVGEYETAKLPRLELVAKMIGKDVDVAHRLETGATEESPRSHGEQGGQSPVPCSSKPSIPVRRADAGATAAGRPLLSAKNLGRRRAVQPLDLEIAAGEVVGLAGLLGSGRTETARLLFGLDRPDSGRIEVNGALVPLGSPRRAIACGLGFCPEDRQTEGLIPELSVRENVVLALQARRGWWRALGRAVQEKLAEHYIQALKIATPDSDKPAGELSGGSQQKVILARWLAAEPRVLILDEPTRGIDVGAKAEIERIVAELCAAGLAILFISSELDEVVRNCQRVVVLRERAKVGELAGAQVDLPATMHLIAAHTQHE
jgi:monosaccharide-transporting ATPase